MRRRREVAVRGVGPVAAGYDSATRLTLQPARRLVPAPSPGWSLVTTIAPPLDPTTSGVGDALVAPGPGACVELRHDGVDGAVVTVSGDVACRDVAVLSRHLHTELDASPAAIVVDLTRLGAGRVAVRQVLAVVHERAAAGGTRLRLIESGHPPESGR